MRVDWRGKGELQMYNLTTVFFKILIFLKYLLAGTLLDKTFFITVSFYNAFHEDIVGKQRKRTVNHKI
jgi:hypothetical protein